MFYYQKANKSGYSFEVVYQQLRFKMVEDDDAEAHNRLRLFNARVEGASSSNSQMHTKYL